MLSLLLVSYKIAYPQYFLFWKVGVVINPGDNPHVLFLSVFPLLGELNT